MLNDDTAAVCGLYAGKLPRERSRHLSWIDELGSKGCFRIQDCERGAGGRGGNLVPSADLSGPILVGENQAESGHLDGLVI